MWLVEATAGGFFLVGGDEQNFGSLGNIIFSWWRVGGDPSVGKTLIFRLLLLKETICINRVLTRPER